MEAAQKQEMEFANATREPLVVYWAREGESLRRSTPLKPGEAYKLATSINREGRWLRVIAITPKGATGSKEWNDSLPWSLDPAAEERLADRKLFDQTFSWDTLKSAGGRVVIASARGSP